MLLIVVPALPFFLALGVVRPRCILCFGGCVGIARRARRGSCQFRLRSRASGGGDLDDRAKRFVALSGRIAFLTLRRPLSAVPICFGALGLLGNRIWRGWPRDLRWR